MGTARKKRIPNLLRKHRKLAGYRQHEVAKMLDLKSANRISRWEKGLATPGLFNLLKLAIIYSALCDQLYYDLIQELRLEIYERKANLLQSNHRENCRK